MAQKDTVRYILTQVLGLEDNQAEKIIGGKHGYSTPRKLSNISESTISTLLSEGTILTSSSESLRIFKKWYAYHRDTAAVIPVTLTGWQEKLTEDTLEEFSEPSDDHSRSTMYEEPLVGPTAVFDTAKSTTVRLNDYPSFNGRNETWEPFKRSFKSAASLTVLGQLFNVDISTKLKLADHKERLLNDLFYKRRLSMTFIIYWSLRPPQE